MDWPAWFAVTKHPPATREEIESFEARRGLALPIEYRELLLEHDGVALNPESRVPGIDYCSAFREFLAIGPEPRPVRRVDRVLDLLGPRMLPDLVPIADTYAGNFVVLATGQDIAGQVFFWDHECETTPPTMANTTPLSESIQGFLSSVRAD